MTAPFEEVRELLKKPRVQHHGIIVVDTQMGDRPELRVWPYGFTSYGDSFLVWGEHRGRGAYDHTLHVIYEGPLSIAEARFSLGHVLTDEERLIDYVVISDKVDWSENEETITLEQFERRWSQ